MEKQLIGDITLNNKIDESDIAQLLIHLQGKEEVDDPIISTIADVNNDGKVDWQDYELLRKHLDGVYTLDKWS